MYERIRYLSAGRLIAGDHIESLPKEIIPSAYIKINHLPIVRRIVRNFLISKYASFCPYGRIYYKTSLNYAPKRSKSHRKASVLRSKESGRLLYQSNRPIVVRETGLKAELCQPLLSTSSEARVMLPPLVDLSPTWSSKTGFAILVILA